MRTLPRQEDQLVGADERRCQLDPATWLQLPDVAACRQPARVAIQWPDDGTEHVIGCPGHALAAIEARPKTAGIVAVPQPPCECGGHPSDTICTECEGTGLLLDDGSLTGLIDCYTLCFCVEGVDTVQAYVSAVVAYALANSYPGYPSGGVGRADVAPGLGRHVGIMLDLVHQWVRHSYRGATPCPPSVRPLHVVARISGPSIWSFE